MKKILYLLLGLACVGCTCKGGSRGEMSQWMEKNGHLKVLATTAMIGTIVEEVGKGHVDTLTLIQGDLDPHSYQLVKGDDEKLLYADIIFYNGLGLEHGPSLHSHLVGNEKAYPVGEYIASHHPEEILYEGTVCDPHIWMDISLWSEVIPFVVEVLSKEDPDHAPLFAERGDGLLKQFDEADQQVFSHLQEIPVERRYLVTSHDAFNYFTRRYLSTAEELATDGWMERFNAPEGLSPDSQLSSHEITMIIEHLQTHQIETLFPESNLSQDSIHKIVSAGRDKGLNLKMSSTPLYGDAMGPKDSPGGTYLGMIRHNANTIYDQLAKQ